MSPTLAVDPKEMARYRRRQKRLAVLREQVAAQVADLEGKGVGDPWGTIARKRAALAVIESGRIPCRRCGGSGRYEWGAVSYGGCARRGVCFRCNGSGGEGPAIPNPLEGA